MSVEGHSDVLNAAQCRADSGLEASQRGASFLFGDSSFICVVLHHLVDCPTVCLFDSDEVDWPAPHRTEYMTTSQLLV